MNKKLKNALKKGFEAPVPADKKKFLQRIPAPPVSYWEFIWTQASYIRKRVWLLSALFFAAALIAAGFLEKDMLWVISAFMPLLALSVITESGRSEACGMAEFELSTRFSLKSVVLARMGILGVLDFFTMCLMIPLIFLNSEATVLQSSVYMLCPYLLTTFSGLWAVRKFHGKEAIYLCAGIAVSISIGNIMAYQITPFFYEERGFIWWLAALIALAAGSVNQCCQMIKQKEELAWNL